MRSGTMANMTGAPANPMGSMGAIPAVQQTPTMMNSMGGMASLPMPQMHAGTQMGCNDLAWDQLQQMLNIGGVARVCMGDAQEHTPDARD